MKLETRLPTQKSSCAASDCPGCNWAHYKVAGDRRYYIDGVEVSADEYGEALKAAQELPITKMEKVE